MPDLLQTLLSFPQSPCNLSGTHYEQSILALRSSLRQMPSSTLTADVLGKNCILSALDPAKQSMGYLLILLAHYKSSKTSGKSYFPDSFQPGGDMWSKSLTFLETFDPVQIRYVGHEFTELIEAVARAAEIVSRPLLAARPIKVAMVRLDPSCSTLTRTHTIFVSLCLRARACRLALPVIEKPICHIPTQSDQYYLKRSHFSPCDKRQSTFLSITEASGLAGKLSHKTYLEYFLYGAMVYLALKQWENAIGFLHIVITTPTTSSVSKIMVEAYKKWILASLLAKGTILRTPQTASPYALKAYRPLARPYEILGEVFKSGSLSRLKAEIRAGNSVWQNDNNVGLVLQTVEAFRKFSILKLERTFAALPIPDMTCRVPSENRSAQDIEQFSSSVLAAEDLMARLVQPPNSSAPTVLRFCHQDQKTNYRSELQLWTRLVEDKIRVKSLTQNISKTDIKLELGREYIESLRKTQRRKNINNIEESSGLKGGPDSDPNLDEDIMANYH